MGHYEEFYGEVELVFRKDGSSYKRPVPRADSPKREREGELCEAAYRCDTCDRPWIVFAVHGEPTDGVDDPRKCRFCEDGIGRRIR